MDGFRVTNALEHRISCRSKCVYMCRPRTEDIYQGLEVINTKACRWISSGLIVMSMYVFSERRLMLLAPLTDHCFCPYIYVLLY
jgi:hypothetical protein